MVRVRIRARVRVIVRVMFRVRARVRLALGTNCLYVNFSLCNGVSMPPESYSIESFSTTTSLCSSIHMHLLSMLSIGMFSSLIDGR